MSTSLQHHEYCVVAVQDGNELNFTINYCYHETDKDAIPREKVLGVGRLKFEKKLSWFHGAK
jgi:hypothetical protein